MAYSRRFVFAGAPYSHCPVFSGLRGRKGLFERSSICVDCILSDFIHAPFAFYLFSTSDDATLWGLGRSKFGQLDHDTFRRLVSVPFC